MILILPVSGFSSIADVRSPTDRRAGIVIPGIEDREVSSNVRAKLTNSPLHVNHSTMTDPFTAHIPHLSIS